MPFVCRLIAVVFCLAALLQGSDASFGVHHTSLHPKHLDGRPTSVQTKSQLYSHGEISNDVTEKSTSSGPATSLQSRRDLLSSAAAAALAVASVSPTSALAADQDEDLIEVYFGCGCFWHVQHEFVEAERTILKRSDEKLTARAGYAGGKAGAGVDGKVCYHNAANIADYGKLGHAEVVSLNIPASQFSEFAVEYCKLFEKGLRPDQYGDRGSEYRNLVGLPGGAKSEYAKLLVRASQETGDQLDFAVGKGNDSDAPKVVFVMDTLAYPFFIAEEYHQFHDGFKIGENYPNSYNSLAGKFKKAGEDFGSCPNGMLGVGVGGL